MNPDDDVAELARLETRIRQLRAKRAQFKRSMAQAERKRETQRLCTLGRALTALSERNPDFHTRSLIPFLRGYITRDADRDVLAGTRFDVGSVGENEHTEAAN